jgi:hypothetical protein
MKKHNYKQLDIDFAFKYREDRKKQANELGYKYISECLIKEYRKIKSLDKVGEKLKLSQAAILYALKKFGEPRQPIGGYRPGDIRWGYSDWDKKIRTGFLLQ